MLTAIQRIAEWSRALCLTVIQMVCSLFSFKGAFSDSRNLHDDSFNKVSNEYLLKLDRSTNDW